MKNLSLTKNEDIDNFYKIISENVKRIRIEKNKPQLDLVLEMGLKSTAFLGALKTPPLALTCAPTNFIFSPNFI